MKSMPMKKRIMIGSAIFVALLAGALLILYSTFVQSNNVPSNNQIDHNYGIIYENLQPEWTRLTVNPETNLIYLGNGRPPPQILILDGNDDELIGTISLAKFVNRLVVNQNAERIYALSTYGLDGNKIHVIDTKTNNVTKIITIPNDSTHLAINHDTNKVYVFSYQNKLAVINGDSDQILADVKLFSSSEDGIPSEMAINSKTNKIYLVVGRFTEVPHDDTGAMWVHDGLVYVIDGNTYEIIDNIQTEGFAKSIVINDETNKVYVGGYVGPANKTIAVIDGNTDKIINSIQVGSIKNMAINSATNTIYALGLDSVYVIDGTTDRVANIIPVDDDVDNIATNPSTGKIYLYSNIGDFVFVYDDKTEHFNKKQFNNDSK